MASIPQPTTFKPDAPPPPAITALKAVAAANRPDAPPDRLHTALAKQWDHAFFTGAAWVHGSALAAWTNVLNRYLDPANDPTPQDLNAVTDALLYHVDNNLPWGPSNWQALIQRTERWHRTMAATGQAAPHEDAAWESLVGPITLMGYDFDPILDSRKLHQLGSSMNNCLASFANQCLQGESRLFTIAQDGSFLGVVQLIHHQDRWLPGQAEAPDRASLPPQVLPALQTLAAVYQKTAIVTAGRDPQDLSSSDLT